MEFKDRLKELRKKRGYSQIQLAEKLGLSKSTIGAYETGDIVPSTGKLNLIADFFNVDINYLLGKSDTSTYVLSPEVAESLQQLSERPELKALLNAGGKLSDEDLEFTVEWIERMSKK